MKRFKTINNIQMIHNNEFNWEILKENDKSEVFRINLGDLGQDILTCLYAKNTLSIREFNTTYNGGFKLFMEMKFEDTNNILKSILKAHKLDLLPIYDPKQVKIKEIDFFSYAVYQDI